MKNFKKLTAVVLAAVLTIAMLTACTGGTSREDRAINALNQARSQYGQSELRHSEEADYYAQQLADDVARYNSKNGSFNEGSMQESLNALAATMAEGQTFKAVRIFWNPDSLSVSDYTEQKNLYIVYTDASIVGVGTGSTQYSQFVVVVTY